jgi:hypothetical protein
VNITDWLIAHDFRNLIVDVANEYDLPGPRERFDAENRSGCCPAPMLKLLGNQAVISRVASYSSVCAFSFVFRTKRRII